MSCVPNGGIPASEFAVSGGTGGRLGLGFDLAVRSKSPSFRNPSLLVCDADIFCDSIMGNRLFSDGAAVFSDDWSEEDVGFNPFESRTGARGTEPITKINIANKMAPALMITKRFFSSWGRGRKVCRVTMPFDDDNTPCVSASFDLGSGPVASSSSTGRFPF